MSVQKIALRSYTPNDRSFILATWLRGLYYGDSWFSQVPKHIFMTSYHTILEKVLSNPAVSVTVACFEDDPEVILGYSVSRQGKEGVVLDWIFVKSAWRRIGVGKSLTPANLKFVTHLTKVGKALKPTGVDFNPFA